MLQCTRIIARKGLNFNRPPRYTLFMQAKKMVVSGTQGAGLNVRKTPGGKEVLGKIADGEEILVVDQWSKIEYKGAEAWVSTEFTAEKPASKKNDPTVFRFDHNPLDEMKITQHFGEDPALYKQWGLKGHHGTDFKTTSKDDPKGNKKVYAVLKGTVLEARFNDNNGNFVRLTHDKGAQTVYLHLSQTKVIPGQVVEAGTVIGIAGNTGFSTGPHLHFGYRAPNFKTDDGWMGYADAEPFFV